MKVQQDLQVGGGAVGEMNKAHRKIRALEEHRGIDVLQGAVIDVCKREQRDGEWDLDAIIYSPPDLRPDVFEEAAKKACIDMFGHKPPIGMSLFFHDGRQRLSSKGEKLIVEVQGTPTECVSFGFKIEWPHSRFVSMEKIKDELTVRMNKHLIDARMKK
jgi:hypothetical protein